MLPNRRSLVVQQYVDTFELNITHSPSRSFNRVVKEASLYYLMIETSLTLLLILFLLLFFFFLLTVEK